MKKITKLSAVLMSLALVAGVLTACGAQENEGTSGARQLTVGVIQYATHPSLDNCYEGLRQGLEEAGCRDGDKIRIDFQNAQNSDETALQLAKNMAAKNYDLIVGIATPAATAAYSAAAGTDIPVVFCAVSDPVAVKLVSSLDAPGGNCTGSSDLLNLEGQLKLIRALQPEAKKIGILYTTSETNSVSHLAEMKRLAPDYGFEIVEQGVQSAADIPQAAASLVTKADCINNFTDNNVVENLNTVLAQANSAGISIYGSEIEQVKNGCLAAESLDYVALGRETGKLAARVLGGEKAGDIPVARVKDSKPVVNTDVLEKRGLTAPEAYQSAQRVTTNA